MRSNILVHVRIIIIAAKIIGTWPTIQCESMECSVTVARLKKTDFYFKKLTSFLASGAKELFAP